MLLAEPPAVVVYFLVLNSEKSSIASKFLGTLFLFLISMHLCISEGRN